MMFDVVIRTSKSRQEFLRRAVASVFAQTATDWQITVIASADAEITERLCREWFPHATEKVQVMAYEGEFSLGRALNLGIKAGTSEFISILDDDDTWEPQFLEVMRGYLRDRKSLGYEGVVCQTRAVHETLVDGKIEEKSRVVINRELRDVTVVDLLTINRFTINAFCYPRACFEKLGGYDESLPVCEDWEFNLRFLRSFDVLVHAEALANYHQRPPLEADLSNTVHSRPIAHRLARARIVNDWFRRVIEGTDRYGEMVVVSHLVERVTEEIQNLVRFDTSWKDKIGKIDARTREMDGMIKKLDETLKKLGDGASQRKRSLFSFFRK